MSTHTNRPNEPSAEPLSGGASAVSPVNTETDPDSASSGPVSPRILRRTAAWFVRSLWQPAMFLAAGVALLGLLGIAQKAGWITAGGSSAGSAGGSAAAGAASVDYICPMMCTPPQKEPGRCPVCAMELVPASADGGGDERSVVVDPATRRVANIQTAAVRRIPVTRTIEAVGRLEYDESSLKTIAAYTDGRFDRLYVDFTGAVVRKGDRLATLYSPELYSAQVEYLLAADALKRKTARDVPVVGRTTRRLLKSSRQRLVELGLSDEQIAELDRTREPQSRLDIVAPMSGTVIEKLTEEGEYVKEGQPLFRLADLSTVWLMLDLFPEDVPCVCYGLAVEATVKSLPGRIFHGRVAFIDPDVDPQSRTVSVRVVFPNEDGLLKIGDYAKARLQVPAAGATDGTTAVYDPELAGKWISPRYPHVVSEGPGVCHLSGEPLVPASELGFANEPTGDVTALVVPRNAVLMAADQCLVYVETEPGRFEIRRILTGPPLDDQIVVLKGLAEGEQVATGGNFLLDSQMQLAGNPSLIDPTRAPEPMDIVPGFTAEMLAAFEQLPESDRDAALEQVICPVTEMKLGSMGVPIRVLVDERPVFLCCEGCRDSLLEDPETYLETLRQYQGSEQDVSDSTMDVPAIGAMDVPAPDVPLPNFGTMEPAEVLPFDDSENDSDERSAESPSGRIHR